MAEKRMFSKTIIDSDAFLDMPTSARLLYYDLSMRADDDGFVNSPKKIIKMTGAAEDDLKILALKQFIIPFENGVVVIKHWHIHNYIRKDTYTETPYQEQKSRLIIDKNKTYNLIDPARQQLVDDTLTQIREDKIREDKNSIDIYERNFEIFWRKYPRKVSKEKAKKAFLKAKIDDVVLNEILKSLDKFINSNDWKKENGQYIPYPASWLNQRRWEDEDIGEKVVIPSTSNLDPVLEARFNKEVGEIYGQ